MNRVVQKKLREISRELFRKYHASNNVKYHVNNFNSINYNKS